MIVVSGIRLDLGAVDGDALERAIRKARIPKSEIESTTILKVAVDARRRESISKVYTVGIGLKNKEAEQAYACPAQFVSVSDEKEWIPLRGKRKMEKQPVIAGFGPAGMFAGLLLAENGYAPLIVERGLDADRRHRSVKQFFETGQLDPESNIQFGEGGAGTFSDGKLTTRIGDPLCRYVLQKFVEFGAPKEILTNAKPHIGTDLLIDIVKNIRKKIESLGGRILFETKMEEILLKNGAIAGIKTRGGIVETGSLLLCIGHSARDTFTMLANHDMLLEPKAFSVGVRIEHRQCDINAALYGKFAGHPSLPNGEYQLSARRGAKAVYTFCMCPGGTVVAAASEEGMVVTNGMSTFQRDGDNANSALVVSVDRSDYGDGIFAGMEFQRKLETAAFEAGGGDYSAPAQTVGLFLKGKGGLSLGSTVPTYPRGIKASDFSLIFPTSIYEMLKTGLLDFDKRLKGFAKPDAVMTGVETRTSSPLRIVRTKELEAEGAAGIYPCGEGAGYAGGIVSAAVDGLRCAEALMKEYAPLL